MPGTSRPERVIVKPPKDSRLEQLLCLYEQRKMAAEAAEAAYDEVKKGVLAEIEAMYPEETRPSKAYDIPATAMWPALTLGYKEQSHLQAKLLAEHLPNVYETFLSKSGRWELRRKRG